MKISIEAKALQAAVLSSAKKDLRYYLNGVNIQFNHAEQALVTGTNGHMLFCCRALYSNIGAEFNLGFNLTIPEDVVKKLPKKVDYYELEALADGQYRIENFIFSAIEGKFPDVERLVPASGSNFERSKALLNPDYLQAANKAMRIFYGSKDEYYPLWQVSGEIQNPVIMFGRDSQAVAVIMPIRETVIQKYMGFNKDFFRVKDAHTV